MDSRLVMLHGWGANGHDLQPLGKQLALQHPKGLDVVCLEAPEAHPQPGGRQWYGLFPPQWDAIPGAVEQLRARLLELSSDSIPLERTVLFGFSQGGAMALDCGCTLPLAGLISCSGYAHPDWDPSSQHPQALLMHGRQDQVVPFAQMETIRSKLNPGTCEALAFDDGHTIPDGMMRPIGQFLSTVLSTD